jgi:hypothetical protein
VSAEAARRERLAELVETVIVNGVFELSDELPRPA